MTIGAQDSEIIEKSNLSDLPITYGSNMMYFVAGLSDIWLEFYFGKTAALAR